MNSVGLQYKSSKKVCDDRINTGVLSCQEIGLDAFPFMVVKQIDAKEKPIQMHD